MARWWFHDYCLSPPRKCHVSHPNIPWSFESLLWPSISDHTYSKKLWGSLPCNVFISFSRYVSLLGPWGHHQPSLSLLSLAELSLPCPWPRSPYQPPWLSAPAPSMMPQQGWSAAPCSSALPSHWSCRDWLTRGPTSQPALKLYSSPGRCLMPDSRWLGLPWCPHLSCSWLLKTELQRVWTTCWRNQSCNTSKHSLQGSLEDTGRHFVGRPAFSSLLGTWRKSRIKGKFVAKPYKLSY